MPERAQIIGNTPGAVLLGPTDATRIKMFYDRQDMMTRMQQRRMAERERALNLQAIGDLHNVGAGEIDPRAMENFNTDYNATISNVQQAELEGTATPMLIQQETAALDKRRQAYNAWYQNNEAQVKELEKRGWSNARPMFEMMQRRDDFNAANAAMEDNYNVVSFARNMPFASTFLEETAITQNMVDNLFRTGKYSYENKDGVITSHDISTVFEPGRNGTYRAKRDPNNPNLVTDDLYMQLKDNPDMARYLEDAVYEHAMEQYFSSVMNRMPTQQEKAELMADYWNGDGWTREKINAELANNYTEEDKINIEKEEATQLLDRRAVADWSIQRQNNTNTNPFSPGSDKYQYAVREPLSRFNGENYMPISLIGGTGKISVSTGDGKGMLVSELAIKEGEAGSKLYMRGVIPTKPGQNGMSLDMLDKLMSNGEINAVDEEGNPKYTSDNSGWIEVPQEAYAEIIKKGKIPIDKEKNALENLYGIVQNEWSSKPNMPE